MRSCGFLKAGWSWMQQHAPLLLETAQRLSDLGYIMLCDGDFQFASQCHLDFYLWQTLGQKFESLVELPVELLVELPDDIFSLIFLGVQRLDPVVLSQTLSRGRRRDAYEGLFRIEMWR